GPPTTRGCATAHGRQRRRTSRGPRASRHRTGRAWFFGRLAGLPRVWQSRPSSQRAAAQAGDRDLLEIVDRGSGAPFDRVLAAAGDIGFQLRVSGTEPVAGMVSWPAALPPGTQKQGRVASSSCPELPWDGALGYRRPASAVLRR